jgi:hypothetical protein
MKMVFCFYVLALNLIRVGEVCYEDGKLFWEHTVFPWPNYLLPMIYNTACSY